MHGILGSGLALKVQQEKRHKHLIRRRVPAAQLIQCLWRCYAADKNSMSVATWKVHLLNLAPSPDLSSISRSLKQNSSFVSRFSTRRLRSPRGEGADGRLGGHMPISKTMSNDTTSSSGSLQRLPTTGVPVGASGISGKGSNSNLSLNVESGDLKKSDSYTCLNRRNSIEDDERPIRELTEVHKNAIRGIRKIKYFVARKKFKEALRPYDVKDVIEQYSAGHVDMLSRIKNLQFRLDQILGKQGSKSKDVYESKFSLASRIVGVERQVEDIETKLDTLIDMYTEDREKFKFLKSNSSTPPSEAPPMIMSAPPAPHIKPIIKNAPSLTFSTASQVTTTTSPTYQQHQPLTKSASARTEAESSRDRTNKKTGYVRHLSEGSSPVNQRTFFDKITEEEHPASSDVSPDEVLMSHRDKERLLHTPSEVLSTSVTECSSPPPSEGSAVLPIGSHPLSLPMFATPPIPPLQSPSGVRLRHKHSHLDNEFIDSSQSYGNGDASTQPVLPSNSIGEGSSDVILNIDTGEDSSVASPSGASELSDIPRDSNSPNAMNSLLIKADVLKLKKTYC